MAAGVGDGTTVTFGTTGFSANIVDIDGPGVTRAAVDGRHLGTSGYITFAPSGILDGGEMSMTVHHDPALTVPDTNAAETITIDWAASGNTWSFSGFMTGYSPGARLEEYMTATMTVKVAGTITGI